MIESRVPAETLTELEKKGHKFKVRKSIQPPWAAASRTAQFEKQRELRGLRPAGRRLSGTRAGAGTLVNSGLDRVFFASGYLEAIPSSCGIACRVAFRRCTTVSWVSIPVILCLMMPSPSITR